MDLENALYAGVQIVHNFGAAVVVGLPVAVLWFDERQPARLRLAAWLTLFAWLAQAASGIGFSAVSLTMEGALPDIHNLALAALCVKIFCAATALALLSVYLFRGAARAFDVTTWRGLCILGIAALMSAAVLRWFS